MENPQKSMELSFKYNGNSLWESSGKFLQILEFAIDFFMATKQYLIFTA